MTNYFNPLKDEEHLTYEASAVLHAEQKGLERGREEGKEFEKLEIAKNLLGMGVEVEIIAKSTGLTLEQIKKLIV